MVASERGFEGVASVEAVGWRALRGEPEPFVRPGSVARFAPDLPIPWASLTLTVDVDLDARTVRGTAAWQGTVRAQTLREVRFDAEGFSISSVHDDAGHPLDFEHDGRHLVVDPGQTLRRGAQVRYAIDFEATEPPAGLWFVGPDKHHPERHLQLWSQNQDEDARYWLPCHDHPDHKQSLRVVATVPRGQTALSNGRLLSRHETADGRVVFDWELQRPVPIYLLTLVVGPFVEVVQQREPLPISYWVLPGREAEGERSFGRTPQMVRFYEELLATPYPFEKYDQVAVEEFVFGGMENASMTTQTDLTLHDERAALDFSSEPLVSHELAHQWFGDLVTCHTWAHAWLNEGFATYMELLWHHHRHGDDDFDCARLRYMRKYIKEDGSRYRRPLVEHRYKEPIDLFDAHLYEKGAAVLHMLRCKLGDEGFFAGVRGYLEAHADGTVETTDLRRAMERATGESLGAFFRQWVEVEAGYPTLKARGSWVSREKVFTLELEQRADGDTVFELDIDVVVLDGDGRDETIRVRLDGARKQLRLPGDKMPAQVLVDPRGDLLCNLELELPEPMLLREVEDAPHGIARLQAARALTRRPTPRRIDAVATALGKEPCWAVQAEMASALGRVGTERAWGRLAEQLSLPEPRARRAVVDALAGFRTAENAAELKRRLAAGDPSYLVEAALARALGQTRQPGVFEVLVERLDGPSGWNDVLAVGAIDGLAGLRDVRAIPHLAARLDPTLGLLERCAAARALCSFGHAAAQAAAALEPWLRDPALRLQLTLAATLPSLGHVAALPLLQSLTRAADPRVAGRADASIRALRKRLEPGERYASLQAEVEKLTNKHRQLDATLAKLDSATRSRP